MLARSGALIASTCAGLIKVLLAGDPVLLPCGVCEAVRRRSGRFGVPDALALAGVRCGPALDGVGSSRVGVPSLPLSATCAPGLFEDLRTLLPGVRGGDAEVPDLDRPCFFPPFLLAGTEDMKASASPASGDARGRRAETT